MKQLSLKSLYDLYDLARKQWLVLYKKFQVPAGNNHGIGVWLNAFGAMAQTWALSQAAIDHPADERATDITSAYSIRGASHEGVWHARVGFGGFTGCAGG